MIVTLYTRLRKNLVSSIFSSSILTSNLFGRILFNLRLLEGRVLGKISFLGYSISFLSERRVEYGWVLRNFNSTGIVLDLGCSESFLNYELSARGGKIVGVAINKFKNKPKNISFFQSDICNLPFKKDTFDTIIAVSTIEHIGIGKYGDPLYNEGDILAMKELVRILKSDGTILLTTPIARRHAEYLGGRVYNFRTLSRLTRGMRAEGEYYVPVKGGGWINITEDYFEAETIANESKGGHGVACLALRKNII